MSEFSNREKWNHVGTLRTQAGYSLHIMEDITTKKGRFAILTDDQIVKGYAGSYVKAWDSARYQAAITYKTNRSPDLDTRDNLDWMCY